MLEKLGSEEEGKTGRNVSHERRINKILKELFYCKR